MLSADDLNKYIVFIRSMLSRYISETIQNIAIVTMEGAWWYSSNNLQQSIYGRFAHWTFCPFDRIVSLRQ